jgi:hypothetical protein
MNANSGTPWSEEEIADLRNSVAHGRPVAELADFLCRDVEEVEVKMAELKLERKMKRNTGARWEITIDGKTNSYRDDKAIAIGSAEYAKERNPMAEVTVRDLQGEEETIVIPSQRPK